MNPPEKPKGIPEAPPQAGAAARINLFLDALKTRMGQDEITREQFIRSEVREMKQPEATALRERLSKPDAPDVFKNAAEKKLVLDLTHQQLEALKEQYEKGKGWTTDQKIMGLKIAGGVAVVSGAILLRNKIWNVIRHPFRSLKNGAMSIVRHPFRIGLGVLAAVFGWRWAKHKIQQWVHEEGAKAGQEALEGGASHDAKLAPPVTPQKGTDNVESVKPKSQLEGLDSAIAFLSNNPKSELNEAWKGYQDAQLTLSAEQAKSLEMLQPESLKDGSGVDVDKVVQLTQVVIAQRAVLLRALQKAVLEKQRAMGMGDAQKLDAMLVEVERRMTIEQYRGTSIVDYLSTMKEYARARAYNGPTGHGLEAFFAEKVRGGFDKNVANGDVMSRFRAQYAKMNLCMGVRVSWQKMAVALADQDSAKRQAAVSVALQDVKIKRKQLEAKAETPRDKQVVEILSGVCTTGEAFVANVSAEPAFRRSMDAFVAEFDAYTMEVLAEKAYVQEPGSVDKQVTVSLRKQDGGQETALANGLLLSYQIHSHRAITNEKRALNLSPSGALTDERKKKMGQASSLEQARRDTLDGYLNYSNTLSLRRMRVYTMLAGANHIARSSTEADIDPKEKAAYQTSYDYLQKEKAKATELQTLALDWMKNKDAGKRAQIVAILNAIPGGVRADVPKPNVKPDVALEEMLQLLGVVSVVEPGLEMLSQEQLVQLMAARRENAKALTDYLGAWQKQMGSGTSWWQKDAIVEHMAQIGLLSDTVSSGFAQVQGSAAGLSVLGMKIDINAPLEFHSKYSITGLLFGVNYKQALEHGMDMPFFGRIPGKLDSSYAAIRGYLPVPDDVKAYGESAEEKWRDEQIEELKRRAPQKGADEIQMQKGYADQQAFLKTHFDRKVESVRKISQKYSGQMMETTGRIGKDIQLYEGLLGDANCLHPENTKSAKKPEKPDWWSYGDNDDIPPADLRRRLSKDSLQGKTPEQQDKSKAQAAWVYEALNERLQKHERILADTKEKYMKELSDKIAMHQLLSGFAGNAADNNLRQIMFLGLMTGEYAYPLLYYMGGKGNLAALGQRGARAGGLPGRIAGRTAGFALRPLNGLLRIPRKLLGVSWLGNKVLGGKTAEAGAKAAGGTKVIGQGSEVIKASQETLKAAGKAGVGGAKLDTLLKMGKGANAAEVLRAAQEAGALSPGAARQLAKNPKLLEGALKSAKPELEAARLFKAATRANSLWLVYNAGVKSISYAAAPFICWMAYVEWKERGEMAKNTDNEALKEVYQGMQMASVMEGGVMFAGVVLEGFALGTATFAAGSKLAVFAGVGSTVALPAMIAAFAGKLVADSMYRTAEGWNKEEKDWINNSEGDLIREIHKRSDGKANVWASAALAFDGGPEAAKNADRMQRDTMLRAYLLKTTSVEKVPGESQERYAQRIREFAGAQSQYLIHANGGDPKDFRIERLNGNNLVDAKLHAELLERSKAAQKAGIPDVIKWKDWTGKEETFDLAKYTTLRFNAPTGTLGAEAVIRNYREQVLPLEQAEAVTATFGEAKTPEEKHNAIQRYLVAQMQPHLDCFSGESMRAFGDGLFGSEKKYGKLLYIKHKQVKAAIRQESDKLIALPRVTDMDMRQAVTNLRKIAEEYVDFDTDFSKIPGADQAEFERLRGTSQLPQLLDGVWLGNRLDVPGTGKKTVVELKGEEFLRVELGAPDLGGYWEMPTGFVNETPMFACIDGQWRVRWSKGKPWGDPSGWSHSGAGAERANRILQKLTVINGMKEQKVDERMEEIQRRREQTGDAYFNNWRDTRGKNITWKDGYWEYGTGFSTNSNIQMAFVDGGWRMRKKGDLPWGMPRGLDVNSGRGSSDIKEIMEKLHGINEMR